MAQAEVNDLMLQFWSNIFQTENGIIRIGSPVSGVDQGRIGSQYNAFQGDTIVNDQSGVPMPPPGSMGR